MDTANGFSLMHVPSRSNNPYRTMKAAECAAIRLGACGYYNEPR
jgi:hypothetical protein